MKTRETLTTSLPQDYILPEKAIKQIEKALDSGRKVRFTLLSCPDYSSTGDAYTFEGGLGNGVPLLTKLHTEGVIKLVDGLSDEKRSLIELEVLIADIESENPHLVELYTGGDFDEYKIRCDRSMLRIKDYLRTHGSGFSERISSSFLRLQDDMTSPSDFLGIRNAYYELVASRFANDHSLNFQIQSNVRNKQQSGYYRHEYGGRVTPDEMFAQEFFTIAEYLALGLILGKRALREAFMSVVVVHAGANVHLFNKVKDFEPEKFSYPSNIPKLAIMQRTKPVVSGYNSDDE